MDEIHINRILMLRYEGHLNDFKRYAELAEATAKRLKKAN
jgi:hypothetical protein